ASAVLFQESLVRLAQKIAIVPRELSRHQQARFDDVLHDLARRPCLWVRPEIERRVWKIPHFGDDALARICPRFEHFFEQRFRFQRHERATGRSSSSRGSITSWFLLRGVLGG